MNLFRILGFGADRILAKKCWAEGTVTEVSRLWWLRINTKPVRRFSGDGSVYPHVITLRYTVDGMEYHGKLYIPVRCRVPEKGSTIDVAYDPNKPGNYACYAFDPSGISL